MADEPQGAGVQAGVMNELDAMRKVLTEELACLWSDFAEARNHAMLRDPNPANRYGGWSIQMLSLADRIVDITRLVGATPWGEVSFSLLRETGEGWYEVIHEDAGIEYPEIDYEDAKAAKQHYEERNR